MMIHNHRKLCEVLFLVMNLFFYSFSYYRTSILKDNTKTATIKIRVGIRQLPTQVPTYSFKSFIPSARKMRTLKNKCGSVIISCLLRLLLSDCHEKNTRDPKFLSLKLNFLPVKTTRNPKIQSLNLDSDL